MDIEELRGKIDATDKKIMSLIAERMSLSKKISEYKKENNIPVRDEMREKEVMTNNRETAEKSGVSPEVAEKITRLLIDESCRLQEKSLKGRVKKK